MEKKIRKQALSKEQEIYFLRHFFNFIIPPSENNQNVGAGFLIEQKKMFDVDFLELISKFCEEIRKIVDERDTIFAFDYNVEELFKLFKAKNLRIFNECAFKVISQYYTSETILKILGVKSIPPFPQGNTVMEGDLLLLENVFLKGEIYLVC